MNFFLSTILYYNLSDKKNGELKKSLIEYQLLLTALIESITSLEEGDLEKFDSLVGENACQIRAIRIALIHDSYQTTHNLKENILSTNDTIELILNKEIDKLMLSGRSLKDVFDAYNLDISLSSEELFILKAYLLSEMKEVLSSENQMTSLARKSKCTPVKIKKFNSEVSFSFTDHLASHLRQLLSKSSVAFVQKLALHLEDSHLSHMVSNDFTCEHNTLHCLPMFWTYKILLQTAQNNNIPLIAHVKFLKEQEDGYQVTDEKRFFFKPTKNAEGSISYVEMPFLETDLKKAACVIQGVACTDSQWDKESFLTSITDTILAGAADHRQYPNPDQSLFVECQEYERFKSLALDKGFALQNPSTFFIQHVYSSQVSKALLFLA